MREQMSSCFLLTMTEDSIEGIYDTLKRCALISKSAGGIGVNIHCIRAKGTRIAGTFGESNGLVPMVRVYNTTARYVDQGGNKRPGAFALYLEPWHADVFEFLDLKKNTGKEEYRARELFYALWIPDLFMKRVLEDTTWSLMCPHESPGLADVWGEEFEALYTKYEKEGNFRRQVKARDLWQAVLVSQVETGTPYMLYKDHCNRKSNQQNIGTIKCSNLCTEIVEYSSPDEVAVCNLASIAVNMFVNSASKSFDFVKLKDVAKVVTKNLDKIIDNNYYPIPEAERSNRRHRPIGIGIQGLADAFLLMRLPFESEEAQKLNIQIFETLYYGALEASCEFAEEKGPYATYEGSPVSKGILQYDMWNVTPTDLWDWSALKEKIKKHGVRNSLLIAPMPTASTAQILGNNESIEPYTSNIYSRRVLSGEFQVVNPHLLKDLTERDLWDEDMKNEIIANNGSVQSIAAIPNDLKELYKTVWEVKQKTILKMAADRGAFIDQSQSLNVHMLKPTTETLTSMHFYGWQIGLKTGMYYLRTKPAANALQFTVDKSKLKSSEAVANGTSPNKKDVKEDEMLLTPNGVMYVSSKVRKGIMPRLLEEILSTRIMVKQAMKRLSPSQKILHRIFNARQLALKLIANVTYGYTAAGFSGRMPCAELADSIVQCGRSTLEKAISFVNAHDKWKAKVIYGDTDSLFVLLKGRTVNESFRIGNEIASAITAMNTNPVTLKMEKVYHPCFLLTKKRYVGYSYESPEQSEPVFDAKGIETVRRDTCGAVSKTLEKSLRLFFEHQNTSELKAYLQCQWTRILSGRVSLQDFVFAKEVRLGTYCTRSSSSLPPAAIVATKAMRADPRAEPRYAERIPYVVIHGEPGARLIDMVVDPLELLAMDSPFRLNDLYYINKQIIPALQRVFGLVGADLNRWFTEMPRPVREAFAKHPISASNAQRTRIDYYYLSKHCILCGELVQASAHICNQCLRKGSSAAAAVIGRTSKLEREMQHLAAICRHCGGSDWVVESGVKCTSLACSVFYERRKVQKELQSLSSVAADEGFYPKCMVEWF